MKKSRFTDEQIAFALKQAETGTRIDEICRKMGISDATFYKWRQKYGGLGPSELRKLKQLESANNYLGQEGALELPLVEDEELLVQLVLENNSRIIEKVNAGDPAVSKPATPELARIAVEDQEINWEDFLT